MSTTLLADAKASRPPIESSRGTTRPPNKEDSAPSSSSGLQSRMFTLSDGTTVTLFTLTEPDGAITYVLPQTPRLVYGPAGGPLLSLYLILQRQPSPNEENIHALIQSGVVTLEVQTGVDMELLKALPTDNETEFRRLYARNLVYNLGWGESSNQVSLAQGEGSGSEARTALSAHLNREQALDVLEALENTASRFVLTATVHYRVTEPTQLVQLSGSWAAIHQYLSQHLDEQGRITEAALQQLIPALVPEDLLTVTDGNDNPISIAPETLVMLFMRQSTVVLRKEAGLSDQEGGYTLRPEPHESFHLNYSEYTRRFSMKTQELSVRLEQLIGGVLQEQHWEDYVHLVAQQPGSPMTTTPVRRRIRAERNERTNRSGSSSIEVAAINNTIGSIGLAIKPKPSQSGGIAFIRPKPGLDQSAIDDIKAEIPGKEQGLSIPVVTDRNAPYWPDRVNSNFVWYAPALELVVPSPEAATNTSPFLFSFERIGVTNAGTPALRATVRFTLQKTASVATTNALMQAAIGNAQAVPTESLSVVLLISFIDNTDGTLKQQSFVATLQEEGNVVTATVTLVNDWVRLCYGVLSREGYQTTPAQVQTAYVFNSYVLVRASDWIFKFGGKTTRTPIVYSKTEALGENSTTYFDATSLTFVQPGSRIQYQPIGSSRAGKAAPAPSAGHFMINPRPAPVMIKPQPAPVMIRPNPNPVEKPAPSPVKKPGAAENIAVFMKKIKFATQTQLEQQARNILFPCNQLGRFYEEINAGVSTPIGCQETFSLGQIRYVQYEEILELSHPSYQVYRSLPQPGHFVVVPKQFCISRREAGEEDAYRPLIFLNALIDVDVPANNRVELRATLQPDIQPFLRSELAERLKSYDPAPHIHYPTDISTQSVEIHWALDPTIEANSKSDILDTAGPFISTYFPMDLASWQLMRNVLISPGLSGSVKFKLTDNTEFDANLLLKLDNIRGPWSTGPLEVAASEGQIQLTNRIERTIDVSDLVRYSGNSVAEQVPVEVSIAAGQAHTVAGEGNLEPIFSYPLGDPVAIDEVRSFVEDIYSNLVFINLLNFANHNLVRLMIAARIQGVEGQYSGQLTQDVPVIDIPIVLPLTTYLDQRMLEFQVTKIFSDRPAEVTEWISWNLDVVGPVSIIPELINL